MTGLYDRNTLFARPVSTEESRELQRMSEDHTTRLGQRAQMILQSIARHQVSEIAGNGGHSDATVRRWVQRFNSQGTAGLYDQKPVYLPKEAGLLGQLKLPQVMGFVTILKRRIKSSEHIAAQREAAGRLANKIQIQAGAYPGGIAQLPKRLVPETIRERAGVFIDRDRLFESTFLHGAALAIVFGLVVGMRTVHLNAIGYNSDEAVYAGQGAAIAQSPILTDIFPIFRAHPLLFQFTLALFFKAFGAVDWLGRLVSVGVGIVTVYLIYRLARRLYGPTAGLIAALFMALMPYHVVVTRQVLLDGPMALFSTLTLYLLVIRYRMP